MSHAGCSATSATENPAGHPRPRALRLVAPGDRRVRGGPHGVRGLRHDAAHAPRHQTAPREHIPGRRALTPEISRSRHRSPLRCPRLAGLSQCGHDSPDPVAPHAASFRDTCPQQTRQRARAAAGGFPRVRGRPFATADRAPVGAGSGCHSRADGGRGFPACGA